MGTKACEDCYQLNVKTGLVCIKHADERVEKAKGTAVARVERGALKSEVVALRAERDTLRAENARLTARITDYEDDHRAVVAEKCAPDERHCSCVPHLRNEVRRLTAEVEAMGKVVEEAERVYVTCEPQIPMVVQHLGEALDALRARKAGG